MNIVIEEEIPIEEYKYVRIYGYVDISEEFGEIVEKLKEIDVVLAEILKEFYVKEWDFDGKIRFRNEYYVNYESVVLSVNDISKRGHLFLEYVKENYSDLFEKYGGEAIESFYNTFEKLIDVLYENIKRNIRKVVREIENKYL